MRAVLAALGLLLAFDTAAAAAPSAAWSGRWRLDAPASVLGTSRKPPRWREDSLRVEGRWLDVRSTSVRADGDTLRLAYRYCTDGDAVNPLMGQEVRTRGATQGGVLTFTSVAKVLLVTLTVRERWSLAADGRSFTIERDSESPLGKEHQRLVLRRASAVAP